MIRELGLLLGVGKFSTILIAGSRNEEILFDDYFTRDFFIGWFDESHGDYPQSSGDVGRRIGVQKGEIS